MSRAAGDGIKDAYDIPAPIDPILVELFAYWQAKRGTRSMPSRGDIDPVELRGLVNHVMLYDIGEPGRPFPVRLAGGAIVDFVGQNNTGKLPEETLPPVAAKRFVAILTDVVTRRAPRFRAGKAYWHLGKSYRSFEACFLPLSPDDRTVDIILSGLTFGPPG